MMLKDDRKSRRVLLSALEYSAVAVFWIGLWFIAAQTMGKELLLPSPLSVLKRMGELAVTPEFRLITATSLLRIIYGIVIGILGGVLLGLLTSKIPFVYKLFRPIITVIRATPVASFIILAILWVGRDTLPTFIAALMVLPIVWENMREVEHHTGSVRVESSSLFCSTMTFQPLNRVAFLLPFFGEIFSSKLISYRPSDPLEMSRNL